MRDQHGRGRRRRRAAIVAATAIAAFVGASWHERGTAHAATEAETSAGLLDRASANPAQLFHVVVQGGAASSTADVDTAVSDAIAGAPAAAAGVTDRYALIAGVAADVSGAELLTLAADPRIASITADDQVVLTSTGSSAGGFSNDQLWPQVPGATKFWSSGRVGPAIAIVDSGIEPGRADFGGRVLASLSLDSGSTTNSAGDGFGHGTFVAGIAAGAAPGYAGYAPRSPLVSLDVMDDQGMARTSDVIAAADWIFGHEAQLNIRVANFSLVGSAQSSFLYDPLDKAVEALWNSGVVVVAAAGNYGTQGSPSGVLYAPGNDPFVITVGASDIAGTAAPADDFAAPWSSYGSTPDGFRKPELCAPGRVMNGAVPASSTIAQQHPERGVAPGYMWMSGTSFAAPVVAGAADAILARHPGWTPDQVKGALMQTAAPTSEPTGGACGVGEARGPAAASSSSPPNPDAALEQFLVADPNGGPPSFDASSWESAASSAASWDSASWDSASWDSASWDSAAWSSASWDSASWDSASWDSSTSAADALPASAALVWVP